MPEQVFKVTGTFPSGKQRTIELKLTNARFDPEDPESMAEAFRVANSLTPQNFELDASTLQLLHDDPRPDLKTDGVPDLVRRPEVMSTETIKTVPPARFAGRPNADKPQTVSKGVPEQEVPKGADGNNA